MEFSEKQYANRNRLKIRVSHFRGSVLARTSRASIQFNTTNSMNQSSGAVEGRGRYYPELDGLRALAALMVMAFHLAQAGIHIPGPLTFGQTGVDLFFVLSGFLITSILLQARPGDWDEVKTFYVRRSLRIFPLYFGYLIGSSLLGELPSWQYWVYLQNFAIAWGVPVAGPGHFWSLAVEEQFYLVWPFLVLFSPRRWLAPILWAMVFTSAGLGFYFSPGASFYLTFTRLGGLAAGALLAVAHRRNLLEPHRRLLQVGILVFAVPMVGIGLVFRNVGLTWFVVVKYLLVTGFYACVVATQLVGSDSVASKFLRARGLRFIGRISYGLYVFHPAVFAFCLKRSVALPMWLQASIAITAAFAISVASWYGFERHFIKLKNRWAPEPRSSPHALVEV